MARFFIKTITLLIPFTIFTSIGQLSYAYKQPMAMLLMIMGIFLMLHSPKHPQIHLLAHYLKKGFILAMGIVTIIAFFPIGGWLALPLLIPHSQQPAEAIVVLASGCSPTGEPGISGFHRVLHGLKLFREGKAPKLFISTGNSSIYGFQEAKWVASLTNIVKHPDTGIAILIDKNITTSFTEAQVIKKRLFTENIKTILLVTNASHILRASLCYKKQGFTVLPAPTHNDRNIFYARSSYLSSFNAVIHEWVGLAYYKLLGRI